MTIRENYMKTANGLLGRLNEDEDEERVVDVKDAEEEVRSAQDNPEPNGEEEVAAEEELVNTTKTKRFQEALDTLIGEVQALAQIEDGWEGAKNLEAEIERIEYNMAYLPEIFREGELKEEEE